MGLVFYLIAMALIIISSNNSVYFKVSEMFPDYKKSNIQLGYTGTLVVLFTLLYILNYVFTNEGFFFTVPERRILGRNIPRKALYDGKAVSFEFDSVGSGMCGEEGCHNYGMIKGCPGTRLYGSENIGDDVW